MISTTIKIPNPIISSFLECHKNQPNTIKTKKGITIPPGNLNP
jgi:hypothetical protein